MARKKSNQNNLYVGAILLLIILAVVWALTSGFVGNGSNSVGNAIKPKYGILVTGSQTQPLCSWTTSAEWQCRTYLPNIGWVFGQTTYTMDGDHLFVTNQDACEALCSRQSAPYPSISCQMGVDLGEGYQTYTGGWVQIDSYPDLRTCTYSAGTEIELN